MRLTHARHAARWIALAAMTTALGGAAVDEPKPGERAAAEKLRGEWRPESVTEAGRKLAGADLEAYRGMTLSIRESRSSLRAADGAVLSACELKLDAGRDPKTFDAKEVEGLGGEGFTGGSGRSKATP
jgi:hypothetical protein